MTPINGQRLYFVDDTDIWAGEDLESCLIAARHHYRLDPNWAPFEPCELTDETVSVFMDEINGTLAGSLREALSQGQSTPYLFAICKRASLMDQFAEAGHG